MGMNPYGMGRTVFMFSNAASVGVVMSIVRVIFMWGT
jgi:hypothetical protein